MTSWEDAHKWYDEIVGEKGHYYHQNVILPKLIPLLELTSNSSLLDLGCGSGVLARALPKEISYHGVDLSPSLIKSAKRTKRCEFTVADACKPLDLGTFTHACALLSLQNMARADLAIKNGAKHLCKGGIFIAVLNHPCFRIPRQSHWEVDESNKQQYRCIARYLTPLKIPIQIKNTTTYSYHHSLSDYSRWFYDAGLHILLIEEWISDKKSSGSAAKMENRAREQFPLFLTIKSRKE